MHFDLDLPNTRVLFISSSEGNEAEEDEGQETHDSILVDGWR